MEPIVFRYNADLNLDGAVLDGVPRRDLTAADLVALPAHLQRNVAACLFYEAVAQDTAPVLPELTDESVAGPGPSTARRVRPSETKE